MRIQKGRKQLKKLPGTFPAPCWIPLQWEGDARPPRLSPTQGFGLSVGERMDGGVAAGGSNVGLLIKAICQQAGGKGRRRATRY